MYAGVAAVYGPRAAGCSSTYARPRRFFSRQLVLGDSLDTEHIRPSYDAGVLRLAIPVAARAKPRWIAISKTLTIDDRKTITA